MLNADSSLLGREFKIGEFVEAVAGPRLPFSSLPKPGFERSGAESAVDPLVLPYADMDPSFAELLNGFV